MAIVLPRERFGRLAHAKTKAIQLDCSRDPHEVDEMKSMIAEWKIG